MKKLELHGFAEMNSDEAQNVQGGFGRLGSKFGVLIGLVGVLILSRLSFLHRRNSP